MSAEIKNIKDAIGTYADRILVSVQSKKETKTSSGIITNVQGTEAKITLHGEVIVISNKIQAALASGKLSEDFEEIGVGWEVLFSEFAGSDLVYAGVTYKVLRFSDIMGWVKK